MTLKQFMDANTQNDALVSLYRNGQVGAFAKVSDGSVDSLASEVQAKNIVDFTVKSANDISVNLESVEIGVEAVASSKSLFDVPVSDMQEDIVVSGNKITGTLKKLTGSNPITDVWGEGYFLCLRFFTEDWADFSTVMVGLEPSQGSGLVDVLPDPDKECVGKVTNKNNQKFVVVPTADGETYTFKYDLSGLQMV